MPIVMVFLWEFVGDSVQRWRVSRNGEPHCAGGGEGGAWRLCRQHHPLYLQCASPFRREHSEWRNLHHHSDRDINSVSNSTGNPPHRKPTPPSIRAMDCRGALWAAPHT